VKASISFEPLALGEEVLSLGGSFENPAGTIRCRLVLPAVALRLSKGLTTIVTEAHKLGAL
jgi:hypothetical protein